MTIFCELIYKIYKMKGSRILIFIGANIIKSVKLNQTLICSVLPSGYDVSGKDIQPLNKKTAMAYHSGVINLRLLFFYDGIRYQQGQDPLGQVLRVLALGLICNPNHRMLFHAQLV